MEAESGRQGGKTIEMLAIARQHPGAIVLVPSDERARQMKKQWPELDIRGPSEDKMCEQLSDTFALIDYEQYLRVYATKEAEDRIMEMVKKRSE